MDTLLHPAVAGRRRGQLVSWIAAPVVLVALSVGSTPRLCAADPLQINEFMAGPASDWNGDGTFSSRDDEWVELHNTSTGPLDLTGYVITDGDGIPRYATSGSLAADGHLIVYGKTSYDWEKATGYPAFGLSLGNSGDAVKLWHVSGPDTTLVDSYAYTSHEAAADRSMGRAQDTGPWSLYDGLDPYTGSTPPVGTGCMPTPAAFNACPATPTRTSTWGRLKILYR